MGLTFEWDEEKAKENLRKHKVSFEEAKTVFGDPFLTTFPDPEHSNSEQRYINIGSSSKGRLLIAIHIERKVNIRIISCRKATTDERRAYEEGYR
ncbi:MAG: BrnT family toxin [Dehalococcoidia bacterium]